MADAGDRTAGADARDDDVDGAIGIVPDFFGRRNLVNIRIGFVFELLRHDRARRFINQLLGAIDGAAHALFRRRELEFRPQQDQHLAALDRHRFRHDQDQLVALGCGDERQGDAGIARGRFDDRTARLQQPPGFEGFDHRYADAVLDRSHRVEEFELGQHRCLGAIDLRQTRQTDQGRVAHRIEDRIENLAPALARKTRCGCGRLVIVRGCHLLCSGESH